MHEQFLPDRAPLHECECFPKRSRSEYTNIQHVLVQQIAAIFSIQVNPEEINTKGRHKADGIDGTDGGCHRRGMSGRGGNTTGFLQCTKHNGAHETNIGKQSKSGVWMRWDSKSPVELERDAIVEIADRA